MLAVFFLAALVAVGWLALWSVLPESRLGWSPFDHTGHGAGDEDAGTNARPGGHRRAAVPRGWRAARPAAADLHPTPPERRPAESRRLRREPVAPTRRRP